MDILPYIFVFFVFGHFSQSFPMAGRQDYYYYYDYNNNEKIPKSDNPTTTATATASTDDGPFDPDGASDATDFEGASDQLSVSATASAATATASTDDGPFDPDAASDATDFDGASDQLSVSATASDATDSEGASDQLSATASEDFPRWERPISFGKNDASSPLTTPFAPNIMQQHFKTAGAAMDTTMKNVSNYLGKPFVSVLPSSPSLLLPPPSFLLVFHSSPSFVLPPPSFLLLSPSSPSLLLPPSLLFPPPSFLLVFSSPSSPDLLTN